MYTQNTEPRIDPALRALLAVAKQVTPSGQPTIAAQMASAAQQQQQPQGIAAALQQSEQAAPSVAQNMQQQQMAQMAQQMQPQMQPPMQPEMQPQQPEMQPPEQAGGIASLPIPEAQYAEGGVIGYAGPQGSYIDPMGGITGFLEYENEPTPELDERASKAAQQAAEIRARMSSQSPKSSNYPTASERQLADIVEKMYKKSAAPAAEVSIPKFEMQEGTTPNSLIQALAYELKDPNTSPAARLAIGQKIQELASQMQSGTSPQRDRQEVGILTPREPVVEQSSIERPTAAAAKAIASSLVPAVDQTEGQRLYEAYKAKMESRPDFEAQKAAAMEAAHTKDVGGRDMERAIRLLTATARQGLPGIGIEGLQYRKEKDALDAAFQQGQIAQQEAAQAKAEGNIANLMAANQKLADAKQKYDELSAHAGTSAYTAQTSQYATDVGAQSREEISKMRSAMSEQIANMRIASALNNKTANLRDPSYVSDKISDNVEKQMEAMGKNMSIGMSIQTPEDWKALRNKLLADEVKFWGSRGADVSGVNISSTASGSAPPADVAAILQKYSGNK